MKTSYDYDNNDDDDNRLRTLLDWSAKQGRILTDEGKAIEYYCSERGFPFTSDELPHHHLEKGDSHEVLHGWAVTAAAAAANRTNDDDDSSSQRCPIIGAWSRPLFTGKWEHSTNNEEIVFNIQTATLFIDLRIPTSKPVSRWENLSSSSTINNNDGRRKITTLSSSRQVLESMSDEDLRLYARQHVFAGYSVISQEKNNNNNGMSKKLPICTRHHCIDWNYVSGKPRPRPNKWYIEGKSSNYDKNCPFNVWKEWSYSTDENGQCYYWEKWERISGDEFGKGLRLAMRRRKSISGNKDDVDAIIVAVGDHFNYIEGRKCLDLHTRYADASNTVELVDLALQNGDRETAISYLSLTGGHGTISSGWKVDCALEPWFHGKNLFSDCLQCSSEDIQVIGSDDACTSWEVMTGDESVWDVYECSLSRHKLQQLLLSSRETSRL